MEYQQEENNISEVIDYLVAMFGNVLNRDVISTVVESCGGDLNTSVEALMNITGDGNVISPEDEANTPKQNEVMPHIQNKEQRVKQNIQSSNKKITKNQNIESAPSTSQTMSYAAAIPLKAGQSSRSQSPATGAIPKHAQRSIKAMNGFWTDQVREIIYNHNQGNRTMIILRGVPGSGKSFLAKQLVDVLVGASFVNYTKHIFSTDDYFMVRGQYLYDKYKLSEAHNWNQNRVKECCLQGLSPIIVDNTNIEIWEMEPYARYGVSNGYILEVLEPNTPWARKAYQLVKKTSHNVPLSTIQRKLEDFRTGITSDVLIQSFKISYPAKLTPPIKRIIPAIPTVDKITSVESEVKSFIETNTMPERSLVVDEGKKQLYLDSDASSVVREQSAEHQSNNVENPPKDIIQEVCQPLETCENRYENTQEINYDEYLEVDSKSNEPYGNEDLRIEEKKQKSLLEAQKRLEELEMKEQQWDDGEPWDEPVERMHEATTGNTPSALRAKMRARQEAFNYTIEHAKPPRKPYLGELDYHSAKNLMQNVNDCQDWSKISMFMPPWCAPSESSKPFNDQKEIPTVHTWSNGTCMEIGDTDINGKNKVITATARDINEYYMPPKEKIPEKRMLDKSSMTNEVLLTDQFRCSNQEKHFVAFRKLFKNIAQSDLRDIFDNCCGDVNWAVEIVLDGMANKQFKTVETDNESDSEEESLEQCQCLASYNIIPDVETVVAPTDPVLPVMIDQNIQETRSTLQNNKKKRDLSEETMHIKRQIEQNVVISDNHYSQHCLKIRKMRRGELDNIEQPTTSGTLETDETEETEETDVVLEPSTADVSEDESNVSQYGDGEKIVNVTIGWDCIKELDNLFGRSDMQYPDAVEPNISLPLCILNQINALWMESLMFQLESLAQKSADLVQRDEEFARELALKEEELHRLGQEPAVPDFKEIMDMDLALSLYQKDVAEWRNNIPTDLAAKLSRDKLYNLFPEVNQDTLSELLMAHDNNFQATVEVLLISMGRNDILEKENGVNKFVMDKEIERQGKILEERRKELSAIEWPLLNKGENVTMATVDGYRDDADSHLKRANVNQQQAHDYIRRSMPRVASYYSEISHYHRQRFDHSNSLAVAALMQYHAMHTTNNLTIDLHYLRVKEAMEALDLFLDTHITRLREGNRGRKSSTLFIITGRGSHSPGRPRIKPATKKRLTQRGLNFAETNPGLLHVRISSTSKMCYQVNVP